MRSKGVDRITVIALSVAYLCLSGCGKSSQTQEKEDRPLTFGVLADIQYGDYDTMSSRYFRASLGKLTKCIADLNNRDLDFVIQPETSSKAAPESTCKQF